MKHLPTHIEHNGISYTLHGEVYLPDLKLPADPRPVGRYGRLHCDFLKEHHPIRYNTLALSSDLHRLLADLNEQAQDRRDLIISQLAAAEGITEELKRKDFLAWVGAMNNIQVRAEEIVLHELIYI